MLSGLLSLKLKFNCSKLKSLCDASVTRIGDTLSYGFPQTELCKLERYLIVNLCRLKKYNLSKKNQKVATN